MPADKVTDKLPRTSFLDAKIEISKHFDPELMNIDTTITIHFFVKPSQKASPRKVHPEAFLSERSAFLFPSR